MGAAARRNLRSTEAHVDDESRAHALLVKYVSQLPSRLAFERWLLAAFPDPRVRLAVRQQYQPYCWFTIDNRRRARLYLETLRRQGMQGRRTLATLLAKHR